jgi:hypothetical protein
MQLANATAEPPGPGAVERALVAAAGLVDPAVVAAPELADLDAELLAPPAVAAVGLGELPPQPPTRMPLTSAAAKKGVRRKRVGRRGSVLSCIWSPSAFFRVCASVLRDVWFPHGFLLEARQQCVRRGMVKPP